MQAALITITEYCNNYKVDPSFIGSLENGGLIEITVIDQQKFIDAAQLYELEKYIRWHYDLNINMEGIDAIRHLLQKVNSMKEEINILKNKIEFYDSLTSD